MFTEDRSVVTIGEPAGPVAPSPLAEALPPRRSRRRWRIAAVFLALFLALFAYLAVTAPLSKSLQPIAAPGLTLLSAEGKPIARRGAITDDPVDVADLPAHVPNAFLAIEDRRFYNHMGVDPWGIGRAAVKNLLAGSVREGGSTITQQLAKLAFLSSDRTAARKLQEAILAFWLEGWLTKDEILSRYLSSVYFGDNVYGLRAAAKHYFSKDPEDLTVGQAAMLAGLVKAPSRLAPTANLKGARERGEVVLTAMVEAGVLSEQEADDVPTVKLKIGPIEDLPTGTYFADWVFPQARAAAEAAYGEQTIQTTLEDDLQRAAVGAVRRAGLGGAQVALVAMRPDGRVVAMVGGKNYKASAFNRATQAKRQPGSTFKLFVYLAALRAGMSPETRVLDEPLTIGDWSPKNSDGRYRGPINLREAFAISSNVAAVRISEEVGRDAVIQAARDLGITSPLTDQPSLALGTSGVSLIEMVSAYAAVSSGNFPVKARGLAAAEDEGWFESIRSRFRRFNERSTWPALLDLLAASVEHGTSRAAALPVKTFGKTGTSQDNRDAIFIGFAGDLVAGVWIGNDDNTPLRGIQGGGLPARIWRDFMSTAVQGTRQRAAPAPEPEPRIMPVEELPNASISVPIEGTGYDVGLEVGENGVTVSAQPNGQEPPIPVDIPPVQIAPPPPATKEPEPQL
ncbi:transglycosylase domain-containing protein [Sphingomonas sp. LY54]|uniref:transglycosylase domain-containing protein n=1 Tax=Sphingomonas sp. LY54 TaxID=3095343 RepID=UPI002D790E20|nr:transglycosylase domain-containing protein [Sphingomonas sp. LY54]WRP28289.1 transglycosylase domain-containing protein [Sphingomonas sp. LY54]